MTQGKDIPAKAGALLSWRAVRALTGVSRTTVWRLRKAGLFPDPVVVSPGRVAWREGEVAAWTAGLTPRSEAPQAETAMHEAPPRSEPAPPAPPPSEKRPETAPQPRAPSRPRAAPQPARRAGRRASRASTTTSRQMSFDF